jgi:glucan biosynthesis protein C
MRASMMLLGIYLHVVVGYSGNGHWPYIDAHPTHVLDWTLGLIHAFRMPAFFAMAGFFGALLWNRRGPASFLRNRGQRVVLPFALFWSLLFPIMAAIVISLERGTNQVLPAFHSRELLARLHPMHLWFLEYLIFLYLLGAAVAWFSRTWPLRLMNAIRAVFRWVLQRPFAPLVFALFSWLPLAGMHGTLKDCDGFMPEWLILSAYIPPFTFGWLLYDSRDLLPRFEKHIVPYLLLATAGFFLYGTTSPRMHPFLKAAGNVSLCWFLTFALLGLFLRLCSRPSAWWRYMSDSAYWLYIMHMPVVVLLQAAFRSVPLPALAKVPVVLATSVLVLLATYDLFVRPTWIGALLNGRKYPRRLPEVRKEAMASA